MASDLNFACSLANPNVRNAIRMHAADLEWDSELAQHVVNFFTDEKDQVVGIAPHAHIRAYLSSRTIDEEIDKVIRLCDESVTIGENIAAVLKPFEAFYTRKKLHEVLNSKDKRNEIVTPEEMIARINKIKFVEAESTQVDNLGEMDVQHILDTEQAGGPLPSRFKFIQRALPQGAYKRGQLVQVVGAPGTGKSLFLVNEAINLAKQGYKGYYLALGDLMRIDMITRFSSVITGSDYMEVEGDPVKFYTDEVKAITKNIRMSVLPAGTMNPSALADLILTKIDPVDPIDFIIVDYDANFASKMDNMYEEGDNVYNAMSQVARPEGSPYRLVFIASQPKIAYWDKDELPMECAAESSRKQAIVDIMITIGKNPNTGEKKAGIMKCAKVRRGKGGPKSCYLVQDCGFIQEISEEEYSFLPVFTSEKPKTKKNVSKNTGDKPWNKHI